MKRLFEEKGTKTTRRQKLYLVAIDNYGALYRFPPTQQDIARSMGVHSRNSVICMLNKLKEAGLVAYKPDLARTVRLTRKGKAELKGFEYKTKGNGL